MSALTERKKKEIDMLYRKMKAKRSKVFLNILINSNVKISRRIGERITKSIYRLGDVQYSSYSLGTNNFTAEAQWNESDAVGKVDLLKIMIARLLDVHPSMVIVQAKILYRVD